MRANINELMDQLGVGYVPGNYESIPWSHYDSDKGVTCSAEVRMGMDGDEVEAEIQFLYDAPPPGKDSTMEQICNLHLAPVNEGQWTATSFAFRGQPYGKDAYDWESKACLFFQLVVQDITAGKFPDVEELLDDAFHKRERFSANSQGGGGKSVKIKPGQLLNPKGGGRGF